LRNSTAVDQLQAAKLLVEKGRPPTRLMTNVDTQCVGVNAYRGVWRSGNVEPAERCPEEWRGWKEVAHGSLPTLQTYLIAYEQRVAGSLAVYEEVEAGAVGRCDARHTFAPDAQLGL
jgi:hypothetical protein